MRATIAIFLLALMSYAATAQNQTDISLFWKKDHKQVSSIESLTGNLYQDVGHHGPAVENEWLGLRLYFDKKVSIDVYNKTKPQLELKGAEWYPTPEQQEEGWGADQYKVGQTVGLGGVRLWDGEKEVLLNPVTKRIARVKKEFNESYMEMLSEGVPYKGDTISVLVRVTVFSGFREAKVEAFAFSDKPVQFLTGINYHPKTDTKVGPDYICTWGLHPEDVASIRLNIGAAILYNPDNFEKMEKTPTAYWLISKPCNYISTHITSAGEKEKGFGTMKDFVNYVEKIKF